jgi:hypothetical protein
MGVKSDGRITDTIDTLHELKQIGDAMPEESDNKLKDYAEMVADAGWRDIEEYEVDLALEALDICRDFTQYVDAGEDINGLLDAAEEVSKRADLVYARKNSLEG